MLLPIDTLSSDTDTAVVAVSPPQSDTAFLISLHLQQHADSALYPLVVDRREGEVGVPVSYHPSSDHVLTGILLLSFLLLVFVTVRRGLFLAAFFRGGKIGTEQDGKVFTHSFPLYVSLCLSIAVLYSIYIYSACGEEPFGLSAFTFPIAVAAGMLLFLWLKEICIRFVDVVFFSRKIVCALSSRRAISLFIMAVPVFFTAVCALALDLPAKPMLMVAAIFAALALLWLLIDEFLIFSHTRLSVVHKIVYFCTLEIAPWLLLGWFMATILNYTHIGYEVFLSVVAS